MPGAQCVPSHGIRPSPAIIGGGGGAMRSRRFLHAVLRRVLLPSPALPTLPLPPTQTLASPSSSPWPRIAASVWTLALNTEHVTSWPPPAAPLSPPPPPPPPPPYKPTPRLSQRSPLTARVLWNRALGTQMMTTRWTPALQRFYSTPKEGETPRLKVNPFKVNWKGAKAYLADRGECPDLLIKVPDRSSQLYSLVKKDHLQPRMLTETAKVMIRSLIMTVLRCHEEKVCLGKAISMENLIVSSVGTLQLKEFASNEWTEKARVVDLASVSDLIRSILKLRHGRRATRILPSDFFKLLDRLKKPETPQYILENHPSLLPAATYAAAFLKLYEHIMERSMKTEPKQMVVILNRSPYCSSWLTTTQNNPMLKAWVRSSYSQLIPSDHIQFGRNVMCHPQEKNAHATTELGVSDYTLEATTILFQHTYSYLLPALLEGLWEHYKNQSHVMDALSFAELYTGIPVWAVSKSEELEGSAKSKELESSVNLGEEVKH